MQFSWILIFSWLTSNITMLFSHKKHVISWLVNQPIPGLMMLCFLNVILSSFMLYYMHVFVRKEDRVLSEWFSFLYFQLGLYLLKYIIWLLSDYVIKFSFMVSYDPVLLFRSWQFYFFSLVIFPFTIYYTRFLEDENIIGWFHVL